VKTNAELLRVRSLHQTADMDLKSECVNKQSIEKSRDYLQKRYDELQKESAKIKSKNETLERSLHSKTELLQNVQEE